MKRIGQYPKDVIERALSCYGAGRQWESQSRMRIFESELPLVSEKYRFGGTLDAMFIQDKLSLGDYKTGSLYPDHLIQVVGGYALLWEENFPTLPIEGGYHLLKFGKEGDFAHHWWLEIPEAKKAFLLMRELYDLMNILEKRV